MLKIVKNFINIVIVRNKNKVIKMSKSIGYDFFSILNHIKLGILLPSYISVLSCNGNDHIEPSLIFNNSISSTSTSLGVLTGIVIFGVVNYIVYKSIKYLTHDILNKESSESINQVNTISSLNEENSESTQVISSVENIDGENPISVILPTNNFTCTDTNSILNIIHSNDYIPLGGQNGFNYIINTSHHFGFGKTFKYMIWARKNMLGGATDDQISAYFDLKGRNKLDINMLNIFDKNTSLFISDIMPLLQGDRWITNPIPNINYCRMVNHLQYLRQYNDTYTDILVCSGSSNLKYTYLNSFFYLNVDAVNASIKLQEIFLELAKNGHVF
jgi:hypothetical protein